MELKKYYNKKVRLTDIGGIKYEGRVGDYVWPDDNEPEGIEAIILDYPVRDDGYKYQNPIQFNAPEIKSLEVIR